MGGGLAGAGEQERQPAVPEQAGRRRVHGGGDLADLSTPNDAYFAYVDTILAKIAAKNMVVLLTPLYVGYGAPTTQSSSNEGWSADMNANSSAKCYKYGQYVGDRYRNQKNIIWVDGGDAFQPAADIATCEQQVMQGIKDGKGSGGSTRAAHHALVARAPVDRRRELPGAVELGLSVAGHRAARCAGRRMAGSPVLPAYVIEAWYEGEHAMTRDQLRQAGVPGGAVVHWRLRVRQHSDLALRQRLAGGDGPDGSVDWQRAGTLLDSVAW